MYWNVVELSENGRYAKLHRGFLIVMEGKTELGRVIIDELSCLMLTAEQATLSKPVMVRLAEEGVPIIICGQNYHPLSINLPYSHHHQSTKILRDQISCTTPLRKRLWQSIVKTKIQHQLNILKHCQPQQTIITKQLEKLVTKVRSGDPENTEAQAARIYWQALMGKGFTRQTESNDIINAALNYGYSIVRAACARAIVTAGLQPALGLHHHNQNNPFCLVDDLMEVYRPLIDYIVFFNILIDKNHITNNPIGNINQKNDDLNNTDNTITFESKEPPENTKSDIIDFGDSSSEKRPIPISPTPLNTKNLAGLLSSDNKRQLVKVLQQPISIDKNNTTVSNSMQILAFSLVKSYQNKEVNLKLPSLIIEN